ncbi:hypothetical protein Tco_1444582, partial [Tanacetum coccineum]
VTVVIPLAVGNFIIEWIVEATAHKLPRPVCPNMTLEWLLTTANSIGRLGCRVPRKALNVEINLHGLLELNKSDLSDLICPSAYQLLRNSSGDSRPELFFDKSASPERLFSLARVSLVEASKPVLSFGCSGEDYTSSVEKLDKKKGDVDSKLENLQSEELTQTDAKLSKQALTVRGLQNSLVLEKSKSQGYKDAMDGLREEITQFVGSGVESLVRKLLLSDEFHAALARVASFGINYGVNRGLRMGRTDVEFEAAVQQVSNFHAGVKADFDKALVDFHTTPFPFLSKIAAAFGGTLFDVAQILPDKFIRSATSVFVAPFSVNEAPEQVSPLPCF